jgi:AraC-like DNA-binding protein
MYVNILALKPLYNYLKQQGFDSVADEVLSFTGVDLLQLGSHLEKIPAIKFYEAFQLAIKLTGDELLGLHAGQLLNPSNMGLLGYAMCNCATIKEALYLVLSSNAYGYGNDSIKFAISFDGKLLKMKLDFNDDIERIRPWIEFTTAGWISHYHHLTNFKYKNCEVFREVALPFSSQGQAAEYERILGCRVLFNQKEAYILGSPQIFDQEIYTADRGSYLLFMDKLGLEARAGQFERDIQGLVKKYLPKQIKLEDVASYFNVSVSTIKRRLKERGTSFTEITADLKMEMAQKMLRNREAPLEEISCSLGYEGISAFSRAFKARHGITPTTFRKIAH